MELCRGTNLKHLDISDNTNVKGICSTLLSLNLSKNGIVSPFELPLPPCQLQNLNLSYNKIPYFYFKSFLKMSYFPSLRQLTLDHIQLNGPIYPIQQFLEQTHSLATLSVVECDLTI
jgi:hypothetical protein